MSQQTSMITGITGQCGSVLAELLLNKGHRVIGIVRRTSDEYKWRLKSIMNNSNLILNSGDITDQNSIDIAVCRHQPDFFYNAASQSHVGISFNQPLLTGEVTGLGVVKCLESIRKFASHCRFLQFSTSEMFGATTEVPQDENTPFDVCSPYAAAKLYGFYMTKLYAKAYNLFASNMIMFNTEGPTRGLNFVTRKITRAVAMIKAGLLNELILWDLSPQRDWSYVGDSMDAAYRILQHSEPDIFVVASGESHSIQEFVEIAFDYVKLNWKQYVKIDESRSRPAEVPVLRGCSDKIKDKLGWRPQVSFEQLVHMMVDDDIRKVDNCINN